MVWSGWEVVWSVDVDILIIFIISILDILIIFIISILSFDQEKLCLAEIQSKNDQKEESGENSCEGHLQTEKCQKDES